MLFAAYELVQPNTKPVSEHENKDTPSCLLLNELSTKVFHYDAKLVQSWLDTCASEHPGCREYQQRTTDTVQRPTRILELGPQHVKLRCDLPANDVYPYTTLSHVWGTDSAHQLSLTKANLLELQDGIAIDSLPVIYREATVLTKILGMQYLWIDSLCICQDSATDWQFEASRMAAVYGNAMCNIACPFPPNSPVMRVDPRSYLPCVLRPPTPSTPGLYASRVVSPDADWNNIRQWPMSSRAWILQEQLLSPRTIFFGHHNLKWVCSHERRDEWLGAENVGHRKKWFLNVEQEASQETFERPDRSFLDADGALFVDLWENLIEEYRSTRLTNPSDRIIAFAGIARAVHNVTQMTYLAGIWNTRLVHGLLWCVKKDASPRSLHAERVVHTVPSWSWFAIPISAEVNLKFPITELTRSTKNCNITNIYLATLSSFQWGPAGTRDELPKDSYFDFQDLQLDLETQVLRTFATWYDDELSAFEIYDALSSHDGVTSHRFVLFPDQLGKSKTLPENLYLCLLAEIHIEPSDPSRIWTKRILAGLVLSNGVTCERRGMWALEVESTKEANLFTENFSVFKLLGGQEAKIVLV
jgi:hypothetical protein